MRDFLTVVGFALRALSANKTRSFLTTTGIVVGISAVIAVQAIGRGAAELMRVQLETVGHNYVVVLPDDRRSGGISAGAGKGETLTVEDAEAIESQLGHLVMAVTPVIESRTQLVRENRNWKAFVRGVSHSFPVVRNQGVDDGRFFDAEEQRLGKRVCAIGVTVRKKLFGESVDPLGKMIRIGDMPFHVIGLLTPRGANTLGEDQDDAVLIPYTTAVRVLEHSELRSVGCIQLSLWQFDYLDDVHREIGKLLRTRHKLSANRPDDFQVLDNRQNFELINQALLIVTILLTLCAGISLFVGGVGIMNIMLVSVTERTKEIGLRIAIGARPAKILGQFVLEAVVLSTIGGVIGVVVGVGGGLIVGQVQRWPVSFDLVTVVVAFAFSTLVGVAFGFFPALRASRMNPMECLRYE